MANPEDPINESPEVEQEFYQLNTDGGIVAAQGQASGEAAIGVVLKAPFEQVSRSIGPVKDHHVAEYGALITGLEVALSRGVERINVNLDSALVVNQLSGKSKVRAEHLKPLHDKAGSLLKQFVEARVSWVPRKANSEADKLASKPLGPLRPKPMTPTEELPLD